MEESTNRQVNEAIRRAWSGNGTTFPASQRYGALNADIRQRANNGRQVITIATPQTAQDAPEAPTAPKANAGAGTGAPPAATPPTPARVMNNLLRNAKYGKVRGVANKYSLTGQEIR